MGFAIHWQLQKNALEIRASSKFLMYQKVKELTAWVQDFAYFIFVR